METKTEKRVITFVVLFALAALIISPIYEQSGRTMETFIDENNQTIHIARESSSSNIGVPNNIFLNDSQYWGMNSKLQLFKGQVAMARISFENFSKSPVVFNKSLNTISEIQLIDAIVEESGLISNIKSECSLLIVYQNNTKGSIKIELNWTNSYRTTIINLTELFGEPVYVYRLDITNTRLSGNYQYLIDQLIFY